MIIPIRTYRSVVREQIGARYVGSTALRANTGVVFRSQELVTAAPHMPAVQTWLLNRQTPGMMGPIDRNGLWWLIAFGVTGHGLDPRGLIGGALGAATVTQLERRLMRSLGAELLIVRPDQVVSAVWASPVPETEFLDTTMAILCGRPGVGTAAGQPAKATD
jgi:hypothetical protein